MGYRLFGCHPDQLMKMDVDGTDCRVPNQPEDEFGPPSSWISFKFRKAANRFEVVTSILTGLICCIAGPYRAGKYNDITIFRIGGLKRLLRECGEKTEADQGYKGKSFTVELPDDGEEDQYDEKQLVQNRHETINGKIKNWQCMNKVFRHDINLHGTFFLLFAPFLTFK